VEWHIHAMIGLGILMMLLFAHVYFAPFRRLKQAVADNDASEGARRVGQIRKLVGINLILGLIVVVIASGGRYL
ncbi:MAG: CopD family protein, partial [Alloalcanivorax venustensis]